MLTASCKSEFNLGCLHENVCREDQICIDDGLYGICLDDESQEPSIQLNSQDLVNIHSEIDLLSQEGYTWNEKITQCRMMLLIYNTDINCNPEKVKNDNSISKISILFTQPRFNSKEILPYVIDLFSIDEMNNVEYNISKDGKLLIIQFNHEAVNNEHLLRRISTLLQSKEMHNIKDILVENVEESSENTIVKRHTRRSILNPATISGGRNKTIIIVSTVVGVAGLAGIIATAILIHLKRTQPAQSHNQEKRSSKIIRVKNKRLLPADSESHVEDDDNAVFGEIDENISELVKLSNNFSSDEKNRNVSSSSGTGDPVMMNINVKTGHLILRYMEEHFKNKENFNRDWNYISNYSPDNVKVFSLKEEDKNRSNCSLPYEKSRVILKDSESDFINANFIFDHDPRKPDYIATISPLSKTVEDFWQMIWDQNVVTIVCLDSIKEITRINDSNINACVRYWPQDGTLNLSKFDVHLVSEHRSNLKYVVRSMYLKKKDSQVSRTLTQFHFHDMPTDEENLLDVVSTFLEFRRKVNKSFRGKMSPVVIHSKDGCGITGAYVLIDMILNRISKGIRELDMIASLEHLRDQQKDFINTKEQFKFVTTSIAEEVNELIRESSE